MSILVLDDEVQADYRYLGPEIARIAGDSEYHVYADDPETPAFDDYCGVIISGSTASVYDDQHRFIDVQQALVRSCIEREIPLLGICFGHQLINYALDGAVEKDRRRSTFVEMDVTAPDDAVLTDVNSVVPVLHSDLVVELGTGLESTATTAYNENFCTRHRSAPVWTVQYHPEFTERVEENPSDWSRGAHTFEECNATKTITNFVSECERRK